MNETKETKIFKNSEVAQPDSQTEQIIDDFDKSIETLNEALADINSLEKQEAQASHQNNDLDYLLNSGHNKFEQARNERLKELEEKIKQLVTVSEAKEIEPKEKAKELTKISGILTSQIRSKPSSNTPFMAFLRPTDSQKHSLAECEKIKCQSCEIPVIFRVKSKEPIHQKC